ncbi:hypothetical protein SERLADRAFT_439529 [Serpula lacrymans var. lacrymans S7.9]|uniref:Heme peroxidase n=1 Tax=Serpula lacrymans var. lacrymans (strain S7.9) TaxID=578457 RepID=F8P0T2_SERL9|nr:uncharacterized protein SERLADRAFT_439529 [Serpula lacrymans var. lacrymans S7.9]EGO22766.1 hypothetical protein SERLADRAFT_439529 [Serpula lacrymans var. lacrymans S7.9]
MTGYIPLAKNAIHLFQKGLGHGPFSSDLLTKTLEDLDKVLENSSTLTVRDLPAFTDAANALGKGVDDRKFLLEKLVVLMSRLPDDSELGRRLQNTVIDICERFTLQACTIYIYAPIFQLFGGIYPLYPLKHASSKQTNYAFRSADGSNNNVLFPSFGQAGQPYARSVSSMNTVLPSFFPDPDIVFDALLCRRPPSPQQASSSYFQSHPGGLSSLFFAFANFIIHSIFHTNLDNPRINDASSYLDLSVLYGSSEEDYIAERILAINENGTYYSPSSPPIISATSAQSISSSMPFDATSPHSNDTNRSRLLSQCDEIFHRARLVNTAYFMQIVLRDYVGGILGLVRDGLEWRLNPLGWSSQESSGPSGGQREGQTPRGEGSSVSMEFNLMYRWHAAISEEEEKWLEGVMREMPVADFRTTATKYVNDRTRGSVKTWTFGSPTSTLRFYSFAYCFDATISSPALAIAKSLDRLPSGAFSSAELSDILHRATASPASSFGARKVPKAMKPIEIAGIRWARSVGGCTVGLYAEECKPPIPGAGLCPGYTLSRAILADAVCLTRGDRFLTVDCTPHNLTSWGFQDIQPNIEDGSMGGMLTKLLFRTLPGEYVAGSGYAHFPFLVPSFVKESCFGKDTKVGEDKLGGRGQPKLNIWRNLNISAPGTCEVDVRKRGWVNQEMYKWEALDVGIKNGVGFKNGGVELHMCKDFFLQYEARMRLLTKGGMNGLDSYHNVIDVALVNQVELSSFTHLLISEKSIQCNRHNAGLPADVNDMFVDVVKDVINLVPVYWVVNNMLMLPLKASASLRGMYTLQDWYGMFSDVSKYLYFNNGQVNDWTYREKGTRATSEIIRHLKASLAEICKSTLSLAELTQSVLAWLGGSKERGEFLKEVLSAIPADRQRDAYDIQIEHAAYSLFSELIPTAVLFASAMATVVDYYLDDRSRDACQELQRLAAAKSPEANVQILPYVYKALENRRHDWQKHLPGNVNGNSATPAHVNGGGHLNDFSSAHANDARIINGNGQNAHVNGIHEENKNSACDYARLRQKHSGVGSDKG